MKLKLSKYNIYCFERDMIILHGDYKERKIFYKSALTRFLKRTRAYVSLNIYQLYKYIIKTILTKKGEPKCS